METTSAVKKAVLLTVLGVIATLCCILISFQLFVTLQLKSSHILGWEGDRYLWTAGIAGVSRWDVNQQVVVNRNFMLDGIDKLFVSSSGQIWLYGAFEVWLFEAGKWVQVDKNRGLNGRPRDITQTDDGSIWIATWEGFSIWNQETGLWESRLVGQPGSTLAQGPENSLWLGLDYGVLRMQSGETTHWTIETGLISNRVKSMLVASDGSVWVGTGEGVSRWDGSRWEGWGDLGRPDPDGLVVSKLYETNNGVIWAATSEGVARWDGSGWMTYPSTWMGSRYVLLESKDGHFWVGGGRGLFRWTGSGWHEYGIAEGLEDSSFSHLVQGTNDTLYLSTREGLYQYDPELDRWNSFPD